MRGMLCGRAFVAACLLVFVGGQPGVHYHCRQSEDGAMRALRRHCEARAHPMHKKMFRGGLDFAHAIADFVREVLGETESELPLRFAYYSNEASDTFAGCDRAIGGEHVTGGGESMCEMVAYHGGLSEKCAPPLVRPLDYSPHRSRYI